ncbi:hypothetical protein ACSBR2_017789 [Camellia fascicularis]
MLKEECIQYQLWPWLLTLMFVFGTSSNANKAGLCVGEITVGKMTPLERAVKESRANYKKVVLAQASVDGVKVDDIDTNLAVMKLLSIRCNSIIGGFVSLITVPENGMLLFIAELWRQNELL